MGKKLFLALVCLLPLVAQSQSNVPGRFSLSTGFDLGIHLVEGEVKSNGTTVDEDTTGAGTKQFTFNAHYSIVKWFSAGLGFKTGSYVEDPDPGVTQRNNVGHFYLDTRFYMVNNEKFNLYGGLAFGSSGLHINRKENILGILFEQQLDFKSPYSRLHIGGNWYIGNKVGFWFQTEFNRHVFNMYSYTFTVDGTSQNTDGIEYILNTRGFQIALGVCIKFK